MKTFVIFATFPLVLAGWLVGVVVTAVAVGLALGYKAVVGAGK